MPSLGGAGYSTFSEEDAGLSYQFPKGPWSQHPRLTLSPKSRVERGGEALREPGEGFKRVWEQSLVIPFLKSWTEDSELQNHISLKKGRFLDHTP